MIKGKLGFQIFSFHYTIWIHSLNSIHIWFEVSSLMSKTTLCPFPYMIIIFRLMWVCDVSRQNIFMCPDLLLFVCLCEGWLLHAECTCHLYPINRFWNVLTSCNVLPYELSVLFHIWYSVILKNILAWKIEKKMSSLHVLVLK